jgi:RNA polymerase sigma factor (sigma-70 family)
VNVRHACNVKPIEMLDSELNYVDENDHAELDYVDAPVADVDEAEDREAAPDAESVLSHDLASTDLLSREDEASLAHALMRARRRLLKSLRDKRRLTRLALENTGRGVVPPESDFREREALIVWKYAQRLVKDRRRARAAGFEPAALRSWMRDFGAALEEYRQLRDKMVRANLRLVSVLARRYRHPTLTYLDLFQEGVLGLLRAVEKYDPERNVRFATYATWWIWQQLGRSVDTYGPLIRTPVHWSQLRRRMQREDDRAPGDEETVDDGEQNSPMAMDPQRLETIVQGFQYISTDAPFGDEDDRALGSVLAASDPAPEDQVGSAALRRQLDSILEDLPQREQLIVRQRFGLGDDQTRTLEEIGHELGVSRERIRQLEARALNLLKQGCEDRGLRDYLH